MILVCAGDPHGIGPEIILKTLSGDSADSLVIGSKSVFEYYRPVLHAPVPHYIDVDQSQLFEESFLVNLPQSLCADRLNVLNIPYAENVCPGRVDVYAAESSLLYLRVAVSWMLRGFGDLLVTAPVHKEAILHSVDAFVGQTEYLADLCGVEDVTMFFLSDKLKVALVTTHIPLKAVAETLDAAMIVKTVRQSADFLEKSLHIADPVIAVAALNPHAGEGGLLASEDRDIVRVGVCACRDLGLRVYGPFPADSLFLRERQFDAYVALYHDQGLIPFKLLCSGRGVNVSLGLPFLRFSVDHGAAYDIAGKGLADASSLAYVLQLARRFVRDSASE